MNILRFRFATVFVGLFLMSFLGYSQRAGDLDSSFTFGRGNNYEFNYGYGADNEVQTINSQIDGKIIIGGNFTTFNGVNRNRIARLNTNGSLDTSFNPGTGANDWVRFNTIQPDGKIIICGGFSAYNNVNRSRIARINIDGSLDTSFNPGTGANIWINNASLQPNGKIIIGGGFTFYNGTSRNYIARLNSNGSLDTSFNPGRGANDRIYFTSIQNDGKIIAVGEFTTFNRISRNHIARLNTDGSLDTTFNPGVGANNSIRNIAIQTDGKILIGGYFTTYNGIERNRIARLNPDGSLDESFNPGEGANNPVRNLSIQNDGKIILCGYFTNYNGTNKNYIVRLNTSGNLDTLFNPQIKTTDDIWTSYIMPNSKILIGGLIDSYDGTNRNNISSLNVNGSLDTSFNPGTGANNIVNAVALQNDGKIIIAGAFTLYNGIGRKYISRLNRNGSIDTSFNPGAGASNIINTTILQTDGKIIIGGNFISYNGFTSNYVARLNSNGNLDATFNIGTGANNFVLAAAVQQDGKVIIGGNFTSFAGTTKNHIARLNNNGNLDNSFNVGSGANAYVQAIALQADGKIIIGGNFTLFDGVIRNYIARLNENGSLDLSFNTGAGTNGIVKTISIQSDGKIIIGGEFLTYNGINQPYLARLNSDGSLDTSFNQVSGPNRAVYSTTLQADGKVIIGGNFTSYNGNNRRYLARLNNDGSLDLDFNPRVGANRPILSTSLLPNNQIIIGGNFTSYNNKITNHIALIQGNTQCVVPIISGDSSFCIGNSTTLTSSATSGNLWNTGDTTRSITVNQAGTYTVRSMNNGCTSAVSNPITVSVITPAAPQIGFDSVGNRCLGSEIIVSVAGNHNQFRWNTGATTRSINVRRTGEYSAEVLDSSGCWSLPSRPARIVFDTAFCIIRISIIGLDSLEASIYADRYEWFLDGIQLLSGNNGKVIPIQGNGVYTVRAIIDGRTSPMSEPIVITSGKKSIATKFEVYPNPAADKVTVNTTGSGTLEIVNTLGQAVITQPANTANEINISKLAKGFYTIRFNGISKMLIVK